MYLKSLGLGVFSLALSCVALAQDKSLISSHTEQAKEPAASTAPANDKNSAELTGFIAIDVLKIMQKEDSRSTMNIGIGTINVDARAKYGSTTLKIKLDLDGDLKATNTIFEEANVTQELSPEINARFGKGIVPFHQKQYGVIRDSYFDGGTDLGRYWTYGDQDKKMLIGLDYGNKKLGYKNYFTFYGATDLQVNRNRSGVIQTVQVDNAKGNGTKVNVADKTIEFSNKPLSGVYLSLKGFDPRDQRGIADKVEVYWSKEYTSALAGLAYWNRLDPHLSWAVVTNGKIRADKSETWYELQYGRSSSYTYTMKERNEILAQIGSSYDLTDFLTVLGDTEVANFDYLEFQDKAKKPTLDFVNATTTKITGYRAKAEAGIAMNFGKRATWTNGVLFEVGAREIAGVKQTKEGQAKSFTSSFTMAF